MRPAERVGHGAAGWRPPPLGGSRRCCPVPGSGRSARLGAEGQGHVGTCELAGKELPGTGGGAGVRVSGEGPWCGGMGWGRKVRGWRGPSAQRGRRPLWPPHLIPVPLPRCLLSVLAGKVTFVLPERLPGVCSGPSFPSSTVESDVPPTPRRARDGPFNLHLFYFLCSPSTSPHSPGPGS